MDTFTHHIRKQTLNVECDSTESALALHVRLPDFNRDWLLPVIDRVFSEASVAGRHIRIERLEVDLGEIDFSEFEPVAPEQLYVHLKEAVDRVLSSPFEHVEKPESLSRLEFLEWYLLRGDLPYWSSPAESFSLKTWFGEIGETDPEALASLVRKTGTNNYVLKRIVCQLEAEDLRRLVAVLDPEHAALILAYMIDLKVVHHDDPWLAVGEAEFDQLLWVLVLTYLVGEAGSQFNRKVFMESLIRGFSSHLGVEYAVLLAILSKALEKTRARRGLPSSMPGVIAELLTDSGLPEVRPPVSWHGDTQTSADLPLSEMDPASLAQLIRRRGSDLAWLERLVTILDEARLIALLRVLEPEQAEKIVAFLSDVRDTHRASPGVESEPSRFDRLMWVIALASVVRESGSEFNRKAFLRSLVQHLAQRESVDFLDVLATLQLGLARTSGRAPLRSSFRATLAALLEDVNREQAPIRSPSPQAWIMEIALAGQHSAERRQLVLNLIEQMPLADVRQLLEQVFPALDREGSPFSEALKDATRNLVDPRPFFARLFVAGVREEPLDFEAIGDASKHVETHDVGWTSDAEQILATVAARLASESESALDQEPTVASLVIGLLTRAPQEGRLLLLTLADRSMLMEPLVRAFPVGTFQILLDLVAGPGASDLKILVQAIEELSGADRPHVDKMRAILLKETLAGGAGCELNSQLFERILDTLFPTPLPERIRKSLLASCRDSAPALRDALLRRGSQNTENTLTSVDPIYSAEQILSRLLLADDNGKAPHERDLRNLDALLEDRTDATDSEVRALLSDRRTRARLLRILPQTIRRRLLCLLEPARWRSLLHAADIFFSAWKHALPESRNEFVKATIEEELFEFAILDTPPLHRLTVRIFERFAQVHPKHSGAEAAFRARADQLADKAGLASLTRSHNPNEPSSQPAHHLRSKAPLTVQAESQRIYVSNAGLVLVSPFLPHLFTCLEMFEKDDKGRNQWRNSSAASRAVHLIQYLADERTAAPEPLLVLNKILCGLPPATPIAKAIELSEKERQLCDTLLTAVIANWTILAGSTAAAVRETFFQRNGTLDRDGDKWKLQVQRKTVDVLLDQISWSFNPVFHDWMPEPVYVTW